MAGGLGESLISDWPTCGLCGNPLVLEPKVRLYAEDVWHAPCCDESPSCEECGGETEWDWRSDTTGLWVCVRRCTGGGDE